MIDKIIHKKLDELQFSSNFESRKFLIVKIPYVGYGGQLSIRILGMKLAYIFRRTVIFDDRDNPYINCYEPAAVFTFNDIKKIPAVKLILTEKQKDKVVFFDFNDYWLDFKKRNYFKNWVPTELKKHSNAKEYFEGQLLLRFKLLPEYDEQIIEAKKQIGFSKPIIGIHIRRGDKKNESSYVPMRIYNYFLKKAVVETGIKKVFVTSDSNDIFSELPQDLGLEYIYDKNEKRYNNANHELLSINPDLKKQETLTAAKIINILSECDYIIGQINTHFTTLSYSLSMTRKNKCKIYFVNRDINDIYINNDPNVLLFWWDLIKKYAHSLLVKFVRKLRPILFRNEKLYKKIKSLYYGEKR